MDVYRYRVVVPVEIEAGDQESLDDAKAFLKKHFFQIKSSANIGTLHWHMTVRDPKLEKDREQQTDSE